MPATVPVAVVDALNALFEAEQMSIFRFLKEGSPHLERADETIKQQLDEMVRINRRHARETFNLITQLGGVPRARGAMPEDPLLAFLSLKFLLPKLVETKKLCIERYENTRRSMGVPPPEVDDMFQRHLADLQAELVTLEQANDRVAASR